MFEPRSLSLNTKELMSDWRPLECAVRMFPLVILSERSGVRCAFTGSTSGRCAHVLWSHTLTHLQRPILLCEPTYSVWAIPHGTKSVHRSAAHVETNYQRWTSSLKVFTVRTTETPPYLTRLWLNDSIQSIWTSVRNPSRPPPAPIITLDYNCKLPVQVFTVGARGRQQQHISHHSVIHLFHTLDISTHPS